MDTVSLDCDCTQKCKSLQHADHLLAVVTRGNLEEVQQCFGHCYNSNTITDQYGRNVLHMAASCRRWEIVDWLLTEKKTDYTVKDLESGWTPLHRSLFYGLIPNALHLIHHGSSLSVPDREGLTPLDIIRKDRPHYVEFSPSGPTDVYTWGTNTNFTLGHINQQSRKHPDLLEEFAKKRISVNQVVVCKYHSVFLSHDGKVYSCGHGQGGRLGHGNEQTYLAPHLIEAIADMKCEQISAARDHTVMLMEGGNVFTCGWNSCHQLGQSHLGVKCVTPKPVLAKVLKGKVITGIEACRFHTVLYCCDSVLTFGLNAGQLGFPKGDTHISYPKKVLALNHKDIVISALAASAAATVVATVKGDIYVLHEYQCRKIASKQINISKIVVHGGVLDCDVDKTLLQRERGDELTILALQAAGKVYCWKLSDRTMKQCCWNFSRQIFMLDMALSKQNIVFVTNDGEGFVGYFCNKKKRKMSDTGQISPRDTPNLSKSTSVEGSGLSANTESFDKEETEDINLHRLSYVHRAVSVAVDPAGLNFAILQSDPKTSLVDVPSVSSTDIGPHFKVLLEEADCMDTIHDIVFKVKGQEIPVHKFILVSRSDYFRKLFMQQNREEDSTDVKYDSTSGRPVQVIDVEKVDPHIFTLLLQYIYTEDCDLLNPGYKFVPSQTPGYEGMEMSDISMNLGLETELAELNIRDIDRQKSAFQVYQEQKKKIQNENKKSGKKRKKSVKSEENEGSNENSPVKALSDTAKRFGVTALAKRLDNAKFIDGTVLGVRKPFKKLRFDRHKQKELCDVSIQATDGVTVECHKCVLVARLEYFRSMLGSGWIETSTSSPLKLPIPGDILINILDYLYTDDANFLKDCQNVELVCNLLTVADQLLIVRLKEICEVALADLISLKNVAELLEFASVYNAVQLKSTCIQFINLNLATLLEMRTLEVLGEEVLEEVSLAYREMIPAMSKRMITPYSGGYDVCILATEKDEDFSITMETEGDNLEYEITSPDPRVRKVKSKRRSRKRTISTDNKDDVNSVEKTSFLEGVVPMETNNDAVVEGVDVEESKPIRNLERTMDTRPDRIQSTPISIPNTASCTTVWGVQRAHTPSSPSLPSPRNIQPDIIKLKEVPSVQKTATRVTPTKLSQKQRKKLAREQQEKKKADVENEKTGSDEKKESIPKVPVNPWGTIPKSPSAVSFRNVLEDEENSNKIVDRRNSASTAMATSPPVQNIFVGEKTIRWGLSSRTRQPSEGEKSPVPTPSPQSPVEPINPWRQPTSPRSPPSSTVRFADILEAEVTQTETLAKTMKKPFHLIQIEERAIQELLTRYKAADNPEEFIHVERVSSTMATPIWKKSV